MTTRRLTPATCSIFLDKRNQRGVQALEAFHDLPQGDLSIGAYYTKLKMLANTLKDCEMPVSNRGLIANMARDLSNKFSHAISHLTYDDTKLPSFIKAH